MSDEGSREWMEYVILQASQKPTLDAHSCCSVLMAQGLHGNHFCLSLVITSRNPSLVVKNLPATQETWVWSLEGEDPLEKGIATHSSILVWRIPWTEEPGRLQSMGSPRVTHDYTWLRASLVAQTVKRLSAMQETRVRSLSWEDPLEKEMAIHSSILAWKIPWTAEPGRLPSMGSQRVGHDWATSLSLHFHTWLRD